MISSILHLLIISIALNFTGNGAADKESLHIRINQLGYLPEEHKSGIVFSKDPVKEHFELIEDGSGTVILTIKPVKNQVDDLLEQIKQRTAKNERVLVTTLTKRMSEDLKRLLK